MRPAEEEVSHPSMIPYSKALQNVRRQLPYLPKALKLVWDAAPSWTAAWAALLIVQGVLPVATVYLTRALVNSLVALISGEVGWEAVRVPLFLVLLMALVLLMQTLLASLSTWVRTAQSELVSDDLSDRIQAQALALDMTYYETPSYYDQLHRARIDAMNSPLLLLENMGNLVQNGITLVAMAGVLLPYGLWVPAALLISTLPALYIVGSYSLRQHRWQVENTDARRRSYYYDWIISDRNTAAELRIFELGELFRDRYRTTRKKLRRERINLERNQVLSQLLAGILGLIVMGGSLAWMLWQTAQGLYTLGDLALFYQAFNQGQRLMRTLLQSAGRIYSNLLFLENLFEYLALEPLITAPPVPVPFPAPLETGIAFEDVLFHYPGSEKASLSDFNLTIPAGQVTAIVGENGAGKSTLIKLLCRFFDPDSGKVLIDGTDIRQFDPADLQHQFTIMFQQPVEYQDTASNNIAFGNLSSNPSSDDIVQAAIAGGADVPIAKLPDGYETVLGKWFGDAELSVGEWQRVALARAYLRRAPIIVLDEPTSAMDPWAETDWLSRFSTLAQNRTALIISHRFTTAMHADIIHVMVDGRVIESGSHKELLDQGGFYARSWLTQMQERSPTPNDVNGQQA
jgi:ATP-binding cassette subfamily B protein